MRILLATPLSEQAEYLAVLDKYCPYGDIRLWQDVKESDWQAEYALVWQPENALFQHQTELKAIFNLGAGVDALERLPDLPESVPLYRLEDAGMGHWMLEYVLYGMVHFGRHFDHYRYHQQHKHWQPEITQPLREQRVGILGLGPLGCYVAENLHAMGYQVIGWSRNPRQNLPFEHYAGTGQLDDFLSRCRFVVNLLPAKPETYHLLDTGRLMAMPRGSVLISAGRGSVIDEHALLVQLQTRHIRGALLDVFEHEPLSEQHPFWQQDNILITPHMAAPTQADEALQQIFRIMLDIELNDS